MSTEFKKYLEYMNQADIIGFQRDKAVLISFDLEKIMVIIPAIQPEYCRWRFAPGSRQPDIVKD